MAKAGPITMHIDGLRDVDAALGELNKAGARRVLQQVLLTAGKPVQEQAQAAAPERDADAPVKTYGPEGAERVRRPGTTKALVQIGTRLTPRQARSVRKEGKDFAEVYIGTRDPIARLEENGTSQAPARPFLRPAWEAGKAQVLQTIKTELAGEVAKAVGRARKSAARKAAKLAAAAEGEG